MKLIETPKILRFRDAPDCYLQTFAEIDVALDAAETNRSRVIYGAAMIEDFMESSIDSFFFGGQSRSERDPGRFFREWIIQTSWCSYEAKRGIVMMIAKEIGWNTPEWQEKTLNAALRKVMHYRNAFTHGKFSYDGVVVHLRYYSGGSQEVVLSDDYLSKVEAILVQGFNLCEEMFGKLAEWFQQQREGNSKGGDQV